MNFRKDKFSLYFNFSEAIFLVTTGLYCSFIAGIFSIFAETFYKMPNLCKYFAFICTIELLIYTVGSQDILGCGGFVKSEVEINFSMVEVSDAEMRAWPPCWLIIVPNIPFPILN